MARLPHDSIDLAAEIEGAANALLSIAHETSGEPSVKSAALTARMKVSIVFDDLQKVIANSLRPTVVPAFEAGPVSSSLTQIG